MKLITIQDSDNVAVALEALKKGETIDFKGQSLTILDDVPFAHKVAIKDMGDGSPVIKFGEEIGPAKGAIKKGAWVHIHNVQNGVSDMAYKYDYNPQTVTLGKTDKTFLGYGRKSGEAGIRNYIAVITTVFCANGPAEKLCRILNEKYPKNEHFDGFLPLIHNTGCSLSGDDLALTSKVIANVSKNPNFGGVLFMSLGCEVNDLKQMAPSIGAYDKERTRFIVIQEVADEYAEGEKLGAELYARVSQDRRSPQNLSKLSLGFNCGGSDGFSGITANRLVGELADRLTRYGATTNLTEIPEMFGAEHILMNRCKDDATFKKMVAMIADYKAYFNKYGQNPEGNATQGNIAGGITTLADKSLGCIQKGGKSVVVDVVQHGDRIVEPGFNIVVGPGKDLEGITAQIAAGATLIIFTTGRGTPCGFAGPTFRLSTNSALYNRKPHWNDFNAGRLLDGESAAALTDEFYDLVIRTAEGNYRTRNEENGFYQMGIFKDGVID